MNGMSPWYCTAPAAGPLKIVLCWNSTSSVLTDTKSPERKSVYVTTPFSMSTGLMSTLIAVGVIAMIVGGA